MKAIALFIFALFLNSAHASFMSTTCSNSTGSVKWESGHNENTMELEYKNFIPGVLTLEVDQVNINYLKEVVLNEVTVRRCGYSSQTRIFASKVRIIPSEGHPTVLQSYFPRNMVEADVICTFHMSSDMPCTER